MRIYKILLITILIYCFSSCQAQKDNGKTFNATYQIGKIPGFNDFLKLNEHEIRMDSLYTKINLEVDSMMKADTSIKDKEVPKKDLLNNRSRLTFYAIPEEKTDQKEIPSNPEMPTPCECFLDADTIFVRMAMGFFGGFGFNINIMKDKFQSSFYEYTDDVKPYKSNIDDKEFSSMALAKSKYQFLILNEKPTFKEGQQLSGFLTFTSNDYYVSSYDDKLEPKSVAGKLFFTCQVKKGPMLFSR